MTLEQMIQWEKAQREQKIERTAKEIVRARSWVVVRDCKDERDVFQTFQWYAEEDSTLTEDEQWKVAVKATELYQGGMR